MDEGRRKEGRKEGATMHVVIITRVFKKGYGQDRTDRQNPNNRQSILLFGYLLVDGVD